MRDVRRQRVRQWTGALVLALPFVVVTALETTARLATIQPREQILQRATGIPRRQDARRRESLAVAQKSGNSRFADLLRAAEGRPPVRK